MGQIEELLAAANTLQDRVDRLEAGYLMKMNELYDWGWRVRRDILAHELFLQTRQGQPHWEEFLESLLRVDTRFTLSEVMSASDAQDMVEYLNRALAEVRGADPGEPPPPPFL